MWGAVISDCGKYRYVLRRAIPSVQRWVRPCTFIMLNPSTADASVDDPTIRRCIKFAERERCTVLNVVNLFAYRATDPKDLLIAIDPVGPDNLKYLEEELNGVNSVMIAAWGANKMAARMVPTLKSLVKGSLVCLGKTKEGSPRHPLYVPADQPLEPFWEPEEHV